jgi:glycine dehydrogenase
MLDSVSTPSASPLLAPTDTFARRHIGPDDAETARMLESLGVSSLNAMIDAAVPEAIRLRKPLALPAGCGEHETLAELRSIAGRNRVLRNYIGQGYSDTITPPVIQRNILENPGWYTAYTPYQAEIAQGRLEALVNFQTLITNLTAMDIANASLLDEATAAAEAMAMARSFRKNPQSNAIVVSSCCHPQTIDVVRTRAEPLGIQVVIAPEGGLAAGELDLPEGGAFALLLQYPTTLGEVEDYQAVVAKAHTAGALVIVAADLLALTVLKPPGEWGADIVVGSAQRFGVPLGHGGPHAAYMATKDAYKRSMPGRLVGVSKDAHGTPAFRLSLQTREQHIRRDKATSNICTAQVLLAVMASMYAVYHGPEGLRRIAERVHLLTATLKHGLQQCFPELVLGTTARPYFDTITVNFVDGDQSGADEVEEAAKRLGINLGRDGNSFRIALDETTDARDVRDILRAFNGGEDRADFDIEALAAAVPESDIAFPEKLRRTSAYLTHPVFNTHHTETEMLRYIRRLEAKDLSLTTSMIPLGSCTMKLNATSEMLPVTWPEFGKLHPFCPPEQADGYRVLCDQLEAWLGEITGFAGVLLEPNAGSQGEYAGLLVIRKYHESRGEGHRNVCLIPTSAHGTNPASAVMAGFKVVPVNCLSDGDIDLADLKAKADQHGNNLGALMVTYPSTHGVFEATIREICETVHSHGGQVYMDGANMNAQVGLCRPGDMGADVCHLNLHKTFCIPHGGGGPGMGPIGVAAHLVPFLPDPRERSQLSDLLQEASPRSERVGAISAAPRGSASILTISWMYIRMMGGEGLTHATKIAILNANYIARRLDPHFPVLFKGQDGWVAHECIIDLRGFKHVTAEDVAKRLMDFGFHAPTLSWPVAGTLMIEPTESESKAELDRFCDAMIAIHEEIVAIESGAADKVNNPLKNAPHTAFAISAEQWDHPYSREQAVFPAPWLKEHKFWPAVGRIDNVWGDRNLFCACVPIEEPAE